MYPVRPTSSAWDVKPNKSMAILLGVIMVTIFVWVRMEDTIPPTALSTSSTNGALPKFPQPAEAPQLLPERVSEQQTSTTTTETPTSTTITTDGNAPPAVQSTTPSEAKSDSKPDAGSDR